MSGSEGRDRVHNFFDQENFSHQRTQTEDGNRLVSSGFHWAAKQQEGSNLNFNQSGQHSSLVHGSPFSQSPQRSDMSPHVKDHINSNGYTYDHHLVQAKHIETNFMGMNREPSQHNLFPRGSVNSAQYENGSEQYRNTSQEFAESPVNFNFLGSHQQINSQQLGMPQSLPRQQSGLNERQLLQQQIMLRNLHEVQRQQQIQQQEGRQTNSVNHLSSISQQTENDRSASLNDNNAFQDESNYGRMPQLGTRNPSWLQGVVSPATQGASNGLPFSPERNAPVQMLGFAPHANDQSLYGFPVSNSRGSPSQYSQNAEKPMAQSQREVSNSAQLPANQYATVLGSRSGLGGSSYLTNASSPSVYHGTNMGNFSQASFQQNNASIEFQGRQKISNASMNAKETTVLQTPVLQDAAPLDPIEKKFLFGSDDNIWDAFGKSSGSGLEGFSMLEGSDFQNSFPPVQTGSWSALMQTALAETSSGDTSIQEEWSGLNLPGGISGVGQQLLALSDNEKQSRTWVNGNADVAPPLTSEQYMLSDGSEAAHTQSVQGRQMSNLRKSSNMNERLQQNAYPKSSQLLGERNRELDNSNAKPHSENNLRFSSSGPQQFPERNFKVHPGSGAQHSVSSNNFVNQAYKKSSHDNHMESVPPGEDSLLRSTGKENPMHHWKEKHKGLIDEEMQNNYPSWKSDSVVKAPAHVENVKPNSNNQTGPIQNSTHRNSNDCQKHPTGHHFNHWKHVGPVPEMASPDLRRSQPPLGAHPHVLDSSVNSFTKENNIGGASNCDQSDNSGHAQQPVFWNNASSNGFSGTTMSGTGGTNVTDGKQNISNQIAGKSPGYRNFQYHPMGNLSGNVETYSGLNQINKTQVRSSEQTLFVHQGARASFQNDKAQGTDSHAGLSINHLEKLPGSLDRSDTSNLKNNTFHSSQTMLELLNKGDQSRENSAEASRNSLDQNVLSKKPPAETSDSSGDRVQHNQFPGSHVYGLQLGPPHQRYPVQNRESSPQSSSQAPNSHSVVPGRRSSGSSQADPQGVGSGFLGQRNISVATHNIPEGSNAVYTSGYPDIRNQFQNRQVGTGSIQSVSNQSLSADKVIPPPEYMDDSRVKAPVMQSSVGSQLNMIGSSKNNFTLHSNSPQQDRSIQSNVRPPNQGSFPGGFTSQWTNVPKQQAPSNIINQKALADLFTSQSHVKTLPTSQIKEDDLNHNLRKRTEVGAQEMNSQTQASKEDQHANESSLNQGFVLGGAVSHPNHGSSGACPVIDTKLRNNFSLLHQIQAMRSTESDPSSRDSKRHRGQDSSSEDWQSPSRSGQQQLLQAYNPAAEIAKNNLAVSGDSNLPKSTPEPRINQGRYMSSQYGATQYPNMHAFGRNDAQDHHHISVGKPLPQISPQMAPTWFDRYGSFNREQLLPAPDAWKRLLSVPVVQARTSENASTSLVEEQIPAPSVACQVSDMKHSSIPAPVVVEQSTLVASQNMVLLTSQKQKTAILERIPWHQVLTQDRVQDIPDTSASGAKWASATNRLPERVENESEHAEDRIVMSKQKRRLVSTTQLMQQLFDSPPASVLSGDANMNYEAVVYFTARELCGQACSISHSRDPCIDSSTQDKILSEKLKAAEQSDDLQSKVENDFLARAAKLENVLTRLEKQTSILDLRTESQDLEKFSVMNRFAKFHGRGQADGSETSNSAMNYQTNGPLRYVTALPLPRNVPDKVLCISL